MKPRATLAAVLVAAVLGTSYWYWEVKTKPSREQAKEDAKRLFPDLKDKSPGELLLRDGSKPAVLLRKVDGVWQLLTPVQALADPQAVAGVLDQLSGIKREETVEEKAADLRKFGLDQPSGAVTFKPVSGDAKARVLFFGADSFDGGKAYGMIDGKPEVFLTDLASKTGLLKDADALREKHLLAFDPSKLQRLHSSVGKGFTLERDSDGHWQVRVGSAVEPANVQDVDAWIAGLKDLKAQSVVEEAPRSLSRYKLSGPSLELSVAGAAALGIQKGGLQDKGPAFFARVQGQPQVWVLPGSAAAILGKEAKGLMDLRAFALTPGEIDRFTLWQAGTTLTARRKDFKWAWEPPYTPKAGEAPFKFEDFIAGVAGAERLARLPDSARPQPARLSVAFYGAQDVLQDQVFVGSKQGSGQVAFSAVKKTVGIVADNLFQGLPVPLEKK